MNVTASPRLRLDELDRRNLLARAETGRRQAEESKRQEALDELGRLTARVAEHSGMVARTLETIRVKAKEAGDRQGIWVKRAMKLCSNEVPTVYASTAAADRLDEERRARARKLKAEQLEKFKRRET